MNAAHGGDADQSAILNEGYKESDLVHVGAEHNGFSVAASLFLFIRKKQSLIPSFGFILSSAVFAFIFPRVNSGRLSSVFLEISAGSLLFTALLLINHHITAPEKKLHDFIYGFSGGVITMLMRRFSPVLMPEVFSVLIMNALLPALTSEKANRKKFTGKERRLNETSLS